MRMRRTLAALAGLALLGPATGTSVTPASAADLPEREVTSRVVETATHQLVLKGDVNPGHVHRAVLIQKKNCKDDCSWFRYKTVRTDGEGRFKARIDAPKKGSWFWRAKVRKHGGYGTSYSALWRTWTD